MSTANAHPALVPPSFEGELYFPVAGHQAIQAMETSNACLVLGKALAGKSLLLTEVWHTLHREAKLPGLFIDGELAAADPVPVRQAVAEFNTEVPGRRPHRRIGATDGGFICVDNAAHLSAQTDDDILAQERAGLRRDLQLSAIDPERAALCITSQGLHRVKTTALSQAFRAEQRLTFDGRLPARAALRMLLRREFSLVDARQMVAAVQEDNEGMVGYRDIVRQTERLGGEEVDQALSEVATEAPRLTHAEFINAMQERLIANPLDPFFRGSEYRQFEQDRQLFSRLFGSEQGFARLVEESKSASHVRDVLAKFTKN